MKLFFVENLILPFSPDQLKTFKRYMFVHKLVHQTSTYSSDWPLNRMGVWVGYEEIQFSCMFKKKLAPQNLKRKVGPCILGNGSVEATS